MDGSPPPSEGPEESTAREDETQEVSESPERSWAQQVSADQALEESEEVMEVGYAEAAETLMSTAPYRDPTIPDLSSDGETDCWPDRSIRLLRWHHSKRAPECDRVCCHQ